MVESGLGLVGPARLGVEGVVTSAPETVTVWRETRVRRLLLRTPRQGTVTLIVVRQEGPKDIVGVRVLVWTILGREEREGPRTWGETDE